MNVLLLPRTQVQLHHPAGGSQPSITPVLGDPMSSSDLHGHQTCTAKPTRDNFLLTRMGIVGAGAGTGSLGSASLGKLVTQASPFSPLTEMWYGVFLWALMSSVFFHVPAGLLALFTLRHHKYGRFMSVSILLMGIVGPITAGILTSMLDIKIPVKNV
jgi:hypothetical protein